MEYRVGTDRRYRVWGCGTGPLRGGIGKLRHGVRTRHVTRGQADSGKQKGAPFSWSPRSGGKREAGETSANRCPPGPAEEAPLRARTWRDTHEVSDMVWRARRSSSKPFLSSSECPLF